MKLFLTAKSFFQDNPKLVYFVALYCLGFVVFYFEKGLSTAIYYMLFLLSAAVNFGFLSYFSKKNTVYKTKVILLCLVLGVNVGLLFYLKFNLLAYGMFLIFPVSIFLCVLVVKKIFRYE